ncbi:MAG: FAD-binding protein [Cellvibrionales bacterium]|nr:FAD-binding protein [Cellvibrionales bacterium]
MKYKYLLLSLSLLLGLAISHHSLAFSLPSKPSDSAKRVRITFTADSNPAALMPIRRLESLQIWPANDESNITHYNVYWGDSKKNKLGFFMAPKLAKIKATKDKQVLTYEFPANFKMEAGAIYVLVCSANKFREFCGKENNMEKITDDLIGTGLKLMDIKNDLTGRNEDNCPGFEVMETCGDLQCNGIETATSCPSDCADFKVASFNYQTLCRDVQTVFYPTSIEEIQRIIKQANKEGRHVKVTAGAGPKGTTGSASSIVCNDGIVIVASNINESNPNFPIFLEKINGKQVVNTPAGTTLHNLGEWLYERNLGMGFIHLGWRDASVAGAIGTSAHGSSPKHNNVLSHRVVGMDIITPTGELKHFNRYTTGISNPDLWKSLTTHLGYFGVIVRVQIDVEPAQNVHVKVTYHDEKELFALNEKGSILADIADCDYGQYNWFPSLKRYLKTCGKLTHLPAENGANNRVIYPYIDLSQFSEQQTLQTFQLGNL